MRFDVERDEPGVRPGKYPVLKEMGDGKDQMVVLFVGVNQGLCVSQGIHAGMYSTGWLEEEFRPFSGRVTISN